MSYPISVEDLNFLLSHKGQEKLLELSLMDLSNIIPVIETLRKEVTRQEASALVETAILRLRGREKFSSARLMYFLSEALEQASGEVIARHRAKRFLNYRKIADLTCGIGGDLLSLSEISSNVMAVDKDRVRIEMARANSKALGLAEKIEFFCEDLRRPWHVDAAFADPSRRTGGKRVFNLSDIEPSIGELMAIRTTVPDLGVKILPGVDYEERPSDCEVEFISHNRICKEAVLWFGNLRRNVSTSHGFNRSVTILPENIHIEEEAVEPVPVTEPLSFIYEPDPAIIRGHMVEWLAWKLNATKIDNAIAYLTGEKPVKTPLARVWKIDEVFPFSIKEINRRLKYLKIGEIVIKKRGTAVEPEVLRKRLKLTAGGPRITLFLTCISGKQMALLCSEINNENY
ncbi:MAG: hypothetical protein ABRQ37_25750 [Candidatus Eremiobacterota bacterium]